MVDYAILDMAHSLGIMMLAGGVLLLLTTKSPSSSPSPSNAPDASNIPDISNAKDWPRIGFYSALIGIALAIITSLLA